MSSNITMILARNLNNVIGRDGKLPWEKIPEDMKFFREQTLGKVVIVGRETYLSLPYEARRGRTYVVLTRSVDRAGFIKHKLVNDDDKVLVQPSTKSFSDILETIKRLYPDRDLVIAGGKSIYLQMLAIPQKIDTLYLTTVKSLELGDSVLDIEMDLFHEETRILETERCVINSYTPV